MTATNVAALKNKEPAKTFPAMLERFKSEITRALPQHLSADRMSRIALTAFRRNPKLGDCHPASVFAAVIQASQLGLEIDTLGRAYLVPYKAECQFIPGWKGLVDLMSRSGQGSAWTGSVFEGDAFDYELGDSPFVKHKPRGEYDPKKLTHVYAIGHVKGADYKIIEVWPIKRVEKHRDRYNKVGQRHYSYENWEMYARKIPLLQVLKYMPMSAELARAVELDDAAAVGRQGLNLDDAIDGTWVPVSEDEQQGGGNDAGAQAGGNDKSNAGAREVRPTGAEGGDAGQAASAPSDDKKTPGPAAVETEKPAAAKKAAVENGAAQSSRLIEKIRAAKSMDALDELRDLANGSGYSSTEVQAVTSAYNNRKEVLEANPDQAPAAAARPAPAKRGGLE